MGESLCVRQKMHQCITSYNLYGQNSNQTIKRKYMESSHKICSVKCYDCTVFFFKKKMPKHG